MRVLYGAYLLLYWLVLWFSIFISLEEPTWYLLVDTAVAGYIFREMMLLWDV